MSSFLDQETAKGTFRSSSQAATCYYQFNHWKVEAIPLSVLSNKDTIREIDGLTPHYLFLMLNVKQKSCEYQLLKFFGLTRPENRFQVYRLRGERFNH